MRVLTNGSSLFGACWARVLTNESSLFGACWARVLTNGSSVLGACSVCVESVSGKKEREERDGA